jgi:2-methylisocitrate lyase-like PEP mutase family enzyme
VTPKAKAERFRALHAGPAPLVLPNAWDVASARVFEEAGFPAVGTSSAGIAASLGYPDGERISRGEMLKAVARIAGAVQVPVSADVEGGYGPFPKALVQTVEGVLEAGAVGLNLEDGTSDAVRPLLDLDAQVERLRLARETAKRAGVNLVINARTDVYWLRFGAEAARFDRTVQRAKAYLAAGADCVFVPGVADAALIGALAKAIGGPLNVLAGPGCPPVPELKALGVARVSLGSGPLRAALGLTRRLARELLETGTYEHLTRDALPYPELRALLGR